MQNLTTFDSITVTGIHNRIESFKHEEERKKDEFSELVSQYEALCSMAGESKKSFPYTETAAKQVQSEIDRLEKLLVQQREQAYINECVDEVMADMGYDLIGSREVRKKSGKHFRNELFSFTGGTAVNVTFASDGKITMELGGLAREDRIPTIEETEVLTRDMESFCGEFAEFERRMLAKGIIVGDRLSVVDEKVYIENLSRTNKTFLNNEEIPSGSAADAVVAVKIRLYVVLCGIFSKNACFKLER